MCYARRQRSSWARIKLSKNRIWNILSDAWYLSSSLIALYFFVWVVFSFKEFPRSVLAHTSMLCTSLIVVQFSMTERSLDRLCHHSSRQPDYYITTFSLCQYLFSSFFKNFFGIDSVSLLCRCLVDSLYIIACPTLFVNCEFLQTTSHYPKRLMLFCTNRTKRGLWHVQKPCFQ